MFIQEKEKQQQTQAVRKRQLQQIHRNLMTYEKLQQHQQRQIQGISGGGGGGDNGKTNSSGILDAVKIKQEPLEVDSDVNDDVSDVSRFKIYTNNFSC